MQFVFNLSSFIVTKFECGGAAAGKVFGAQCPTPWLAARPSQLSPNTSGKDKYKYIICNHKLNQNTNTNQMQIQVEKTNQMQLQIGETIFINGRESN